MNPIKYMQTDGRWSNLGYPKKPCYIGRDGCGEVSIANMIIEMEQYANYTPATIQPYCKQFAASNCDGTYLSGIPKMMAHYGMTEVMEHKTMQPLWNELAKGGRVACFLMIKTPGGSKKVKWTGGGHFVCAVDYKYEDGKHWLYVKDSYSNSSLRNGWITYEDNMRNAIDSVWSGKLNGAPTPPPIPGKLVVDGIGGPDTVATMEKFFGLEIKGYIYGQSEGQSIYYPSLTAVIYGKGGSPCIAKLQEWLGVEPDGIIGRGTTCAWQKRLRDYGYLAPTETIDGWFGVKSMSAWQECLNNDCKPRTDPPTPPTPTPTVEHYSGPYPNPKKYLEYGDKGTEVTKLQDYMNWFFDGEFFKQCGDADGIYGKNTLKWCKEMQKALGYPAKECDGKVGKNTIAKMKAYGKPITPPTPTPDPTPKRGTYTGQYPNPKKYLEKGDVGTEVKKLQQYLNWSFGGQDGYTPIKEDGSYGDDTYKWTCHWQNKAMGQGSGDGLVGPSTVAVMKDYGGYVPPAPIDSTLVIDVSEFQSSVDFGKVKASGIDGVMIRCGRRGGETALLTPDTKYFDFIKRASAAGLKLGVYFYTQAINEAEGREEARYTIDLIKQAGVTLYYPIAVDAENCQWKNDDGSIGYGRANDTKLSPAKRTQALYGFCDEIAKYGGVPMIYASLSWLYHRMNMSKLPYKVWCAQWGDNCDYEGNLAMWQYSSKGSVNGVKGNVDMNHCYIKEASPMPHIDPPTPPTPSHYTGEYPSAEQIKKASNVGMKKRGVQWLKWLKDTLYHYVKYDDCKTCPICKGRKYDDHYGGNCIWESFASWHHGMGIYWCKCASNVINDAIGNKMLKMTKAQILATIQKKTGVQEIEVLFNGGKEIPIDQLQPMDICLIYEGSKYVHTDPYIGGGKTIDCGRYSDKANQINERKQKKPKIVFRFIGGLTYIQKGDEGEAVWLLQEFINWYTKGEFFKECGEADGIFGENTDKWTKRMQTNFFGAAEADGKVGPKTIEKMKEVGGAL